MSWCTISLSLRVNKSSSLADASSLIDDIDIVASAEEFLFWMLSVVTTPLFVGTLYSKSLGLKSAENVRFLRLCEMLSVVCTVGDCPVSSVTTFSANLFFASFVFFDRVKLSMPSMMIFFFGNLKLRNFELSDGDLPGDFLLLEDVGDVWISTFDAFGDVLRMPTWFMRSSDGIDRLRCVRFVVVEKWSALILRSPRSAESVAIVLKNLFRFASGSGGFGLGGTGYRKFTGKPSEKRI